MLTRLVAAAVVAAAAVVRLLGTSPVLFLIWGGTFEMLRVFTASLTTLQFAWGGFCFLLVHARQPCGGVPPAELCCQALQALVALLLAYDASILISLSCLLSMLALLLLFCIAVGGIF